MAFCVIAKLKTDFFKIESLESKLLSEGGNSQFMDHNRAGNLRNKFVDWRRLPVK